MTNSWFGALLPRDHHARQRGGLQIRAHGTASEIPSRCPTLEGALPGRYERPRDDLRGRWIVHRVLRDLVGQVLDRVVELDVVAHEAIRSEVEDDIRVDAVTLDLPALSLRIPASELRLGRRPPVPQVLVSSDADPAPPRPRADHGSDLEVLHSQGESFAVASPLPVDQ